MRYRVGKREIDRAVGGGEMADVVIDKARSQWSMRATLRE